MSKTCVISNVKNDIQAYRLHLKNRTNEEVSSSVSNPNVKTTEDIKDIISSILSKATKITKEPVKKETILFLNEVEEVQNLNELLQSENLNSVPLDPIKDEQINLDDTPRLSWLIGRDNTLLRSYQKGLYYGNLMMKNFSDTITRYKNSSSLIIKDYNYIKNSIESFKSGIQTQTENRKNIKDPIAQRVIDYILPHTQKRLELLTTYLSTKTKDPELETEKFSLINISKDNEIKNKDNLCFNTNELLNFLEKDLSWYDWYLSEKEILEYDVINSVDIGRTEAVHLSL